MWISGISEKIKVILYAEKVVVYNCESFFCLQLRLVCLRLMMFSFMFMFCVFQNYSLYLYRLCCRRKNEY